MGVDITPRLPRAAWPEWILRLLPQMSTVANTTQMPSLHRVQATGMDTMMGITEGEPFVDVEIQYATILILFHDFSPNLVHIRTY